MRRKFASNLLFLVFTNFLIKPFWIFGIDRVVQNRVGVDAYGMYFALFNYTYLFSVILDFGVNNFNNRIIARHPSRVATYIPNLLSVKLVLGLVFFLLVAITSWMSGYTYDQMAMLGVLALNQILLSYILYLRSNLTALHYFKTDAIISVMDRLLVIICCGTMLYTPLGQQVGFDIRWFAYSQTTALFITAGIAAATLYGKVEIQLSWWRWRFVRAILWSALPYAMLGLLMGIYYRIDAVMLERMRGAAETGIYAKSFRLLDAVNQFAYLFGVPLLPLFAGMIRQRQDISTLLRFSATAMVLISLSAAILAVFFGREWMDWLYHDRTEESRWIFAVLMMSFVPISSVYIYGTLLTAHGSMRVLNVIALAGIAINVSLNLFLIPQYGAIGAAWATLVTQAVVALWHIYACQTVFGLSWGLSIVLRLMMFVVLGLGLCYALEHLGIDWRIRQLIDGLGLVAIMAVLGLVSIETLRANLAMVKKGS
jgi:O-antigen/teichoic acid export membrane protein